MVIMLTTLQQLASAYPIAAGSSSNMGAWILIGLFIASFSIIVASGFVAAYRRHVITFRAGGLILKRCHSGCRYVCTQIIRDY